MPNQRPPTSAAEHTVIYQIRLEGHLSDPWADWFGGVSITLETDGSTCLTGPVTDQAGLHGLLKKVRDLGATLICVTRINPEEADAPASDADGDHHCTNKETT